MSASQLDLETVGLRDVVSMLWARRRWIVASVVVSLALFGAAAFLMKPVYRVTTVLISTESDRGSIMGSLSAALGQVGGLASLAGINLTSGDAGTQEAIAVLTSREFTEQFIADLRLLPRFFPRKWDSAKRAWKDAKEAPTLAKGYKFFDKFVRQIDLDKKTGLVTLQIDWKDPKEGASWANELVRRLNEEMRRRAIESSEASLQFLEQELKTTSAVETRNAINRLIEAQMKKRMLASVTREYAFRVVDRAMPPDRDDPLKPKKLLMIVGGAILGFVMSSLIILSLNIGRRPRPAV